MDEFLVGIQSSDLVEALFDKILHGLDVVVSDLLNVLDTLSALLVEMAIDVAQTFEKVMIEVFQLR